MTVVSCDFSDIARGDAEGRVIFSASKTRGSYSEPGVVTTSHRVIIPLVDGRAISPDLDPGECVIELEAGDVYCRWVYSLPASGEVTLDDLEEMHTEYKPAIVSRVMLAEEAVHADREAVEAVAAMVPDFEDAANRVFAADVSAAQSADAAALSAEEAELSADDSAAAKSASESARDESRSARDTSTTTRDEILELASQVQADRAAAEEAASSASATTKAEVSAAIAALVDAAPQHLDTLAEIAALLTEQGDAAAALTQTVAGKADLEHSHEMGGVTGLNAALAGKAASVHTHEISQVQGLQAVLDGVNDNLAARVRGNFDVVVSSTAPGVTTPQNVITIVTEAAQ